MKNMLEDLVHKLKEKKEKAEDENMIIIKKVEKD